MRTNKLISFAFVGLLAAGCVSVPGSTTAPGTTAPSPVGSAPVTSGEPPATTAPASSDPTAVATVVGQTEVPATPKPTREPRPTPTTPPNIDVFPRDVIFTPHTDDPVAGYHVDVNFVITNTGTDKAKKFMVTVTCLGYSQDQEVFGGIEPGGDYDIGFGFYASIPGNLDYARVFADSTEKITETDEDNNQLDLPTTGAESCGRPPT